MARTRLQPADRRDQLIDFGREHFAAHAFDALAVEQIATLAGVSKGTIYKYFGGRRGFYVATITTVVDELLAAMTPPPDGNAMEVLTTMTGAFVRYAAENRGIYLALVQGGLGADEEVSALLDRVRATAVAHVVEVSGYGEVSPSLDLVLAGWVSFVEATTARWLVKERPVSEDELVEMFALNLAH